MKAVVHVYTADELSEGVAFRKNASTSSPDFTAKVDGIEMLISGEGALMAYNKYNNVFYAPSNASIALRIPCLRLRGASILSATAKHVSS